MYFCFYGWGVLSMIDQVWGHYMKVSHVNGMGDANAWAKLDLTMQQMKVIMMLENRGDIPVSVLADSLNVSLPNMTGIVDRLVQNELVERVPSSHDRRVILLRGTPKSKEIFDSLFSSAYQRFQTVMGQLKKTDQEIISLGLRLLSEAYDRYAEESRQQQTPSQK